MSYKIPSPATMANGGYDAWLDTLQTQLSGLGAPVTATYWHQPHGTMTPAELRAESQRFLDHVKTTNVALGPILNGWLLDNLNATSRANFGEYTSPALLQARDFVGVDSYQESTATSPNTSLLPARAVRLKSPAPRLERIERGSCGHRRRTCSTGGRWLDASHAGDGTHAVLGEDGARRRFGGPTVPP